MITKEKKIKLSTRHNHSVHIWCSSFADRVYLFFKGSQLMLTFGLVILNLFLSHVHGCYKISKPPIYDKKSDSGDYSNFSVITKSPGYYVT